MVALASFLPTSLPPTSTGVDDMEERFVSVTLSSALTERAESVVGEVFSVVGQWQAEQQKQVQEFQEEVVQRAQKAKERAAVEVVDDKGPKTLGRPSTTILTPVPTSPPSTTLTQT